MREDMQIAMHMLMHNLVNILPKLVKFHQHFMKFSQMSAKFRSEIMFFLCQANMSF